jgi:deoxyribodipyrimidine photo-lyase
MQASVRSGYNLALEYAVNIANTLKLPLKVCFVLTPDYPDAQCRHYRFLYEGLCDVSAALYERGINFSVELGSPEKVVCRLSSKAAFVASDCGYTKIQRAWRQAVYNNINCPAVEIEDNVVVPVEVASEKEEYAARTIRPKINSKLPEFLKPIKTIAYNKSLNKKLVKAKLPAEKDIPALNSDDGRLIAGFKGGEIAAKQKLKNFLDNKLCDYDNRNDPNSEATSQLSPYLHFGMISPIEIALKAKEKGGSEDFLEQLIVRRELAINFVYYNAGYDNYEEAIPNWAKSALKNAIADKREYLYTTKQFEDAQTHDPAWNAAQKQMVNTGYMAGYMRMYWGKKVIEWSKTPPACIRNADLSQQ